MGSYYWEALNGENPIAVCHYGITTAAGYGECGECPSFGECDLPLKQIYLLKKVMEDSNEQEQ